MIETHLDFSGLLAISSELDLISQAVDRKVLRDATRAAAALFKDEAIRRTPGQAGRLRRNLVVLTQRRREDNILSGVHVRDASPTGDSDNTGQTGHDNPAFPWRLLEWGGATSAPVPFIRPAYDASVEDATLTVFEAADTAIVKAMRK